jgi:hypothetical protein
MKRRDFIALLGGGGLADGGARSAGRTGAASRVLMGGSGAVVALSAAFLRRLDELGWKQEPS